MKQQYKSPPKEWRSRAHPVIPDVSFISICDVTSESNYNAIEQRHGVLYVSAVHPLCTTKGPRQKQHLSGSLPLHFRICAKTWREWGWHLIADRPERIVRNDHCHRPLREHMLHGTDLADPGIWSWGGGGVQHRPCYSKQQVTCHWGVIDSSQITLWTVE